MPEKKTLLEETHAAIIASTQAAVVFIARKAGLAEGMAAAITASKANFDVGVLVGLNHPEFAEQLAIGILERELGLPLDSEATAKHLVEAIEERIAAEERVV